MLPGLGGGGRGGGVLAMKREVGERLGLFSVKSKVNCGRKPEHPGGNPHAQTRGRECGNSTHRQCDPELGIEPGSLEL